MIVTELKQIVFGCPSRWEGKLQDGRAFDIKYRWGYLRVMVSDYPTDDMMAPLRGTEVLGQLIDPSGWDGVMSEDEMMSYVSAAFKFEQP